jgi:sugar phosphate isomerase/epimerase
VTDGPRIDLLAAYFTLAGDVYPMGPSEVSPWPFEQRVAAAAEAGFTGFGLYYPDLVATAARLGLPAMRSVFDDHGIEHVELEAIVDWFADGERKAASDQCRQALLEAAGALGARHVKVCGDLQGGHWPFDQLRRSFQSLARDATRAGTRLAIELMPFTNLGTLEQGLELVGAADEGSSGLLLDIWHVVRGGISFEQIAALPGELIAAVELNDGASSAVGTLWDDAVENRTLCGEGGFDIAAFLRAVADAGYSGPYGVEIMGTEYRRRPLREAAGDVFRSTSQQFMSLYGMAG